MKDTIKLITLNTWSGRAMHPLMKFFRAQAPNTDIFCLQEVRNSTQEKSDQMHPGEYLYGPLFSKISEELPGFSGFFAHFDDNADRMSLALFVRKSVSFKTLQDFVVYEPAVAVEEGSAVYSARKLQYITLNVAGRDFLIANYHGLWVNGPKTDTPERIAQSETIKTFLDEFSGPKILCGDFNLLPNTKSLKILENGMINLVSTHEVKSTRTPLYRHYFSETEPNFADYVIVSPEVSVKKFEVLPDIASDHSALSLEFS